VLLQLVQAEDLQRQAQRGQQLKELELLQAQELLQDQQQCDAAAGSGEGADAAAADAGLQGHAHQHL